MPDNFDLPIRRIGEADGDRTRRPGGGGGDKVFEEGATADDLLGNLQELERDIDGSFRRFPGVPSVLRVQLKEKALAKSHRPTSLFDDELPIIGLGSFGELLIATVPTSMALLRARVQTPSSKRLRANVSTIEKISIATTQSKLDGFVRDFEHQTFELKVRLFNYHDQAVNDHAIASFLAHLNTLGLEAPSVYDYSSKLRILGISIEDPEVVTHIAEFPSVRSAGLFPNFGNSVDVASMPRGPMPADRFPPPSPEGNYPTVGVIDQGTDPHNAVLMPWVIARYEPFPGAPRDFNHGSFVAGLVANSRAVNAQNVAFPGVQSRVADIVTLPRRGHPFLETQLIDCVRAALQRFPDIRIWNLSLGRPTACDPDVFSDIANALDELQDRHNVIFVIAAGNYEDPPLRAWPTTIVGDTDRISAPADSVRGLAVGSIAHLDNAIAAVRSGEPSPFSRRGPGPAFIPKPELHHHGGNINLNADDFNQIGVMSVDAAGQLAEDVGTSFAAPVIASLAANVDRALGGTASRALLKALLIHNALLNTPLAAATEINYYGFGKPLDVVDVLACDPWAFTFLFEPELVAGFVYSIWPFPMPTCLIRDDSFYGEVVMTLVYDPPLDPDYGMEYCRSNVDISFGTYLLKNDGKRHHEGQVPAEPSAAKLMIEKSLVENGFKWSPTKVYRKRFSGVRGDMWRLKAEIVHRAGFAPVAAQRVALLMTLRDPDRIQPVYRDAMAALAVSGRVVNALRVRDQARYRR